MWFPRAASLALSLQLLLGAQGLRRQSKRYHGRSASTVASEAPSAAEVLLAMGRGINLGNLYDWESGNNISFAAQKERIDVFKSVGFTHIRLPVTWHEIFEPDSEKTRIVEQVVHYAIEQGLYVVLNTHHEHWLKSNYDGSAHYDDLFTALWVSIASRFQSHGTRLVFEVLNEPDGKMGGWGGEHSDPYDEVSLAYTRQINKVGYDAIRGVSPDRIVLVMPNGMGQQQMSKHVYPNRAAFPDAGQDPRLGISVHTYDPWDFCGETGRNSHFNNDPLAMNNHTHVAHRDFLDWYYATRIPAHVGEYGVGRKDDFTAERDTDLVREYYRFTTNFFALHGMPTTVWDDQGWFAISKGTELVYGLAEKIVLPRPAPAPAPAPEPTTPPAPPAESGSSRPLAVCMMLASAVLSTLSSFA